MKKFLAFTLALTMALSLAACGKTAEKPAENAAPSAEASAEPVTINVFAAASLTETLNQIIEMYKTVAPNVTVTPTYDSSGTLQKQIEEGADCDVFFSAAQKQMDALDLTQDAEKNPNKQDFIAPDTRVNLLENKVVLVVPEGNPANITKFTDIANAKMLALGNSDVPVGSYSLKILDFLKLDIKALENEGKVTYGTNVKEVVTQITESTVDCGIVYATDAFSSKLTVVDTATKDMCGQVIYPAAVLNASKNADAAKAFLDYLKTDDAMKIFEGVGFTKAQ